MFGKVELRGRNDARTQVSQVDEAMVTNNNVEIIERDQGENLIFMRVLVNLEAKIIEGPK